MARHEREEVLTTEESLERLAVDQLKPLARLLGGRQPIRKGELIASLTETLLNPERVRALYDALDKTGKLAVQEAVNDAEGELDLERFEARYRRAPDFGSGSRWDRNQKPTTLLLFFPHRDALPSDLRELLKAFVPKPPVVEVAAHDEVPAGIRRPHVQLGQYHPQPDPEEVQPVVRETARAALHNVQAVLRLIDAGGVSVSDKTRRPSQATLKAVAGVLLDGDFYGEDDRSESEYDAAWDVTIQPFAWPLLLQAAGLARLSGTKLQLSPAGRKATGQPAHEVIRLTWKKWLDTTLLDEFNRVNIIKGQQSKGKGGLTAVAPRRHAVVDVLAECPVKKWIAVDELFRLLRALARNFRVSNDPWKLYLTDPQYGSLGYDARYGWQTLQGRYVLAFLFEYAATLGLMDVAYIPPVEARNDFHDRWGTDDLTCLSRYDGLLYFRINALGAWCLGQADHYEPEAAVFRAILQVLPNLDVVAAQEPPGPADILLLERFAERRSEAVWRLSKARVLAAVEGGLTVAELKEFLAARTRGPLPQTVEVFLSDLEDRAGQLEDLGAARMLRCADAVIAHTLANDRRLRGLCQLAGERVLVFRTSDEAAVRRGLRELGYVVPPS